MLAQQFMPTDFDWRVGVLDGEPLFVCQYQMARGTGRSSSTGPTARARAAFAPCAIADAPPAVIDVALRAAKAIGNGLLWRRHEGIGRALAVIEVNDNPNLDHGVEDQVGKDEVWAPHPAMVHQTHRGVGRALIRRSATFSREREKGSMRPLPACGRGLG